MNQSKKSNGNWVLCSSKRFPGKIYFFNVTTGEAMWCSNDSEKSDLKPNLQDENHIYPEPNSPPDKASPLMHSPYTPYQGSMMQCYTGNPGLKDNIAVSMYMPPFDGNYMRQMMPYQFPPPMFWPPQMFMPYLGPSNPNIMCGPAGVLPPHKPKLIELKSEPEVKVETCKQPLNKRFVNFRDPILKFKDNKLDSQMYKVSVKSNSSELSHEKLPKQSPNSQIMTQNNKIQFSDPDLNVSTTSLKNVDTNSYYSNQNKKSNNKVICNGSGDPYVSNSFQRQQTDLKGLNQKKNSFESNRLTQSNQHHFGHRPKFSNFSNVNKTYPKTFDPNKIETDMFGKSEHDQNETGNIFCQSKTNTSLFCQNLNNDQNNFDQNPNNAVNYSESKQSQNQNVQTETREWSRQMKTGLYDQIEYEDLSDESLQECFMTQHSQDNDDFTNLQTDYELNILHKQTGLKEHDKKQFATKNVLEHTVSSVDRNAEEKSTFSEANKTQIQPQDSCVENLDENDLRRLLLSKKRKSVDLTTDNVEGRKIKTTKQEVPKKESTKKVTFNPVLDIFADMSTESISPNTEDSTHQEVENKHWFAVADTNSLLQAYDVIEQFVKSDPLCSLVVPHKVMSEAVAMSRRESPSNGLVTKARQLLRTLHAPPTHVMLQMTDENTSRSTFSSFPILHCCLDIMEKSRVLLITNDAELRSKAEDIGIECFSTQDIIKHTQKQPGIHFDIKKIKISVPNVRQYFGKPPNETNLREHNPTSNRRFNSKSPINNDDLKNSNNREAIRTENVVSSKTVKLNYPNPKNLYDFPKYNEITKSHFSNNVPENSILDSNGQSINAQEYKAANDVASIFKRANQKLDNQPISKKGAIFENVTSKPQRSHSDVENVTKTNIENDKTESNNCIFNNNIPSRHNMQDSEIGNDGINGYEKNSLSSNFKNKDQKERNETNVEKTSSRPADKKIDIEAFLISFSMKNIDLEHLKEQKKEEIICGFRQIMEEYLLDILQDHLKYLKSLSLFSPFTLKESLECLLLAFGSQASVRETADVLSSLLDCRGQVPRSEVLRSLACAMALAQGFKSIPETKEQGRDLEASLLTLIESARAPSDDLATQAASPRDTPACGDESRRRNNFTKDRSELVQYLKKHYPVWADYDETFTVDKSAQSWGKSNKETTVVRICGKNLNKLTLNNMKPMTMNETDNSRNYDKVVTSSPKQKENNLNILKMTRSLDPRIYTKQNPKLTVIVENTNENQNINPDKEIKKHDEIDENQNVVEKKTEQKVVRLFSNYNFAKDPNVVKNEPKQSFEHNFDTNGHTFGTNEQNGPKVLRNIKPIKEYEEKLSKYEQKDMDIDEQDYSTMSLSAYDRFVKEINNNQPQTVTDPQEKYFELENDHLDITNDTNNKSYCMSLENSLTNNFTQFSENIGETLQPIMPKSDELYSKTNEFNSKMKNSTNDNLDCISFDTSGFDEFFGITDDLKLPDSNNLNSFLENLNIDEQKDAKSSESDKVTELSYRLVDTFLLQLKVSFKTIHDFIGASVRSLRSSPCDSRRGTIRDIALSVQKQLYTIVRKLDRIMYRESVSGPRVKDLFKDSLFEDDVRVQNYKQIVSKCVEQVLLINDALKMLLLLTAP